MPLGVELTGMINGRPNRVFVVGPNLKYPKIKSMSGSKTRSNLIKWVFSFFQKPHLNQNINPPYYDTYIRLFISAYTHTVLYMNEYVKFYTQLCVYARAPMHYDVARSFMEPIRRYQSNHRVLHVTDWR